MTEQTTTPLVSRTPASDAAVQERRDRTVALLLSTPVDAHTVEGLRADILDLEQLVVQQNQQVDAAENWATRSSRAVLGLTLLALAGVLSGLAASFGAGRAGRAALTAAAAATLMAALASVAALL